MGTSHASYDHPFWRRVRGEEPAPPGVAKLNWRALEVELDGRRSRIGFELSAEFTNRHGKVCGGYLMAMLDETLGPALATTLAADESAVTVEMKVNFLRAADPGTFVGEGRLVHRGSSVAFMEGQLADRDGRIVATATGTFRIVRIPGSS